MRFSAFLFVLLLCALSVQARAQAFGGGNVASFGRNNTQLHNLLELQYQMQLLKRLIEREKAANNMIAAAVSIGVTDPAVPKPDRLLCAQVPANIPCAMAYHDLYSNYDAEIKPVATAMPMLRIPLPVTAATHEAQTTVAQIAPAASLFWTDITCLQASCSAVISPNPADPASRYRILVGEKLPDGALVKAITAAGVTLLRGKDTVKLDPAPSV